VWTKTQRVVALTDLPAGNTITPGQIRVEIREEFPKTGAFPESADQVVGQSVRMPIRAGSAVRAQQLEAPKEVLSGETVVVDVWSGAAHLKLEARAEGAGAAGQFIPVRNPSTQKRFLARVEGKGRVSVNGSGDSNRNNDHENVLDYQHAMSGSGSATHGQEKE
jgi:flagella basal body P-ring formation protein FlgA